MTKQEALKLVAILEMAYPRQDLREQTVEVYARFLQDLDYKVAEQVVSHYIKTQKWFPSIAEIREACAEMVHDLPTTEQAMEIIRSAVQQYDYGSIRANDLLRQAVATVGFDKIGYSEHPEPLYRQIKEAYERIRTRELHRLAAMPQVGQPMLAYSEDDSA